MEDGSSFSSADLLRDFFPSAAVWFQPWYTEGRSADLQYFPERVKQLFLNRGLKRTLSLFGQFFFLFRGSRGKIAGAPIFFLMRTLF